MVGIGDGGGSPVPAVPCPREGKEKKGSHLRQGVGIVDVRRDLDVVVDDGKMMVMMWMVMNVMMMLMDEMMVDDG